MGKNSGIEQIEQARQTLGLGEYATLEEIKSAYRRLAARYHPDRCRGAKLKICEKKIREINHAKDILMAYIARYRYSFKLQEVRRNVLNPEEFEYLKQFYDGWIAEL